MAITVNKFVDILSRYITTYMTLNELTRCVRFHVRLDITPLVRVESHATSHQRRGGGRKKYVT